MACDYVPPLVEQLHGPDPTAGSDCAICCAKMAIRFATCGALDPSPDKIRAQSGLDEPNPPPDDFSTTITEYAKAINAFDDEARGQGFDGIGAGVHERGRWDDLEPVLKAEAKWISVYVDYGIVNDREPAKSGDKGFDGSHAVSVFGYAPSSETEDGTTKFRIFDPLCDGRRSDVPSGPTWWKASTLKDACDSYAGGGSGTATWCTTPRSEPLAGSPEPEPEPCSSAYAADAAGLLELLHGWLITEQEHDPRPELRGLADWIRRHQGTNTEGLDIPVHSGVTPDDG